MHSLHGMRHGAVAALTANEKPHPVQVNLLGAQAIVLVADPLPLLAKQTDGVQSRLRGFMGVFIAV